MFQKYQQSYLHGPFIKEKRYGFSEYNNHFTGLFDFDKLALAVLKTTIIKS